VTEPLQWEGAGSVFQAVDGTLVYRAKRRPVTNKDGRHIGHAWAVTLNGATIGKKFASFADVVDYCDWGGEPPRMGYDRETGEI